MADVFISYSTKDWEQVNKHLTKFEDNGINCWIAPRDIPYGSNYAREIPNAIKNCRCMLVFVSRNSQSSEEIEKEIQIANNLKKPIIPVRLENCEFTGPYMYHLTHKQWFNAFQHKKEDIQKLINDMKHVDFSTTEIAECNNHTSSTSRNTEFELLETIFDILDHPLAKPMAYALILFLIYLIFKQFDVQIIVNLQEMVDSMWASMSP